MPISRLDGAETVIRTAGMTLPDAVPTWCWLISPAQATVAATERCMSFKLGKTRRSNSREKSREVGAARRGFPNLWRCAALGSEGDFTGPELGFSSPNSDYALSKAKFSRRAVRYWSPLG